MGPRGHDVRVAGVSVALRPERALHWPEARLLAVADLHWGKTETFQHAGIPLPAGVLDDDLARLSSALEATGARLLVLAGDLVHARQGLTPAVVARVAAWRERHPELDVVLVRGNHDRHVARLPQEWRMREEAEALDVGPFRFAHHPEPAEGRYVWSGHLHPVVRLRGRGDSLRLPCFVVGAAVGVLPAFSAFTGGGPLPRERPQRLFAVAGDAVVEV